MKNKKLISLLVGAFFFRVVLAFAVWHPDVNNHIDWGIRFFEYGPEKFYSPEANIWSFTWPNQPPGTIYIFAALRKVFEWVFAFFWFLNVNIPPFPSNLMLFFETNLYPALLKLPAILADLGIAYLIYRFLKDKKKEKVGIFGAALFLLNPVIWYNSAVWGQTDAVINFLMLLSFMLLFKKRFTFSLLTLVLSIYIKASLLIFLPIYLVVALTSNLKLSDWLKAGVIAYLVVGLLTYPFSKGEPLIYLFKLYQGKIFVQQLHVITANAFNIWAAIAGIHERPETLPFLGMTYRFWGMILFAVAYLPALYLVYKKQDVVSVMWALAISAFSSFMLLTNMHERYLYPLFAPLTILAVMEAKLLPIYWAVSGINLINLWHFWWTPKIQILIDFISAGDRLMPRILGFFNFGLFMIIYRKFILGLLKLLRLLSPSRL